MVNIQMLTLVHMQGDVSVTSDGISLFHYGLLSWKEKAE